MDDHITQILQALTTVIAAVAALWAAIKSHQAHSEVRVLKAQLSQPPPPGFSPPGLSVGDLFRYQFVIAEVLALIKQAGRLTVGQSLPVPETKFDLPNGERLEIDPTLVHRTK